MRILVDSSVFIAFFNQSDIFHDITVELFEKLSQDKDKTNVLPIIVLFEVINVLHKRVGEFDERKMFQVFNSYETVDLTFDMAQSFLTFFKEVDLKTSDAIVAAVAKLTGSTLITWDERLIKGPKNLISAQTPKVFLGESQINLKVDKDRFKQ